MNKGLYARLGAFYALIGSVAAWAAVVAVVAPAQAQESPVGLKVAGASVDPVYDPMFRPQPRGFLGGDGAVSIALDETKSLWIFGDTTIGIQSSDGRREGPMPRNTIAIEDRSTSLPGTVQFYWDMSDNIPGSFFMPEPFNAAYWYWPGTGVMVEGELFILLSKLEKSTGQEGFNFSITDTTLFRVANPLDNPRTWRMTRRDLGMGGNQAAFTAGAWVEQGYLYLLGHVDRGGQIGHRREAALARMSLEALRSEAPGTGMEYYLSGGVWSGALEDPEQLQTLFTPGYTEASVHYDAKRQLYVAIGLPAFTPDIVLYTAPALTGPWSEPVKVYHIPELAQKEGRHAYAAKAHPELARSPDEIVLTYVVNTSDFWGMFSDLEIYYPRFVRVDLVP